MQELAYQLNQLKRQNNVGTNYDDFQISEQPTIAKVADACMPGGTTDQAALTEHAAAVAEALMRYLTSQAGAGQTRYRIPIRRYIPPRKPHKAFGSYLQESALANPAVSTQCC